MTNLVTTYIALSGGPTAAGRALQAALGRDYGPNRIGKWRRGDERVPEPVQAVMRRAVLAAEGASHLSPVLDPPERR